MNVNYVGVSASISSSPEHEHENFELILNLKGSGIMTIENTDYQFAPGTVFLCPPNKKHIKQSDSGFKDIYLRFDEPSLASESVITFNDSENKTIKALIYQALLYFNKKDSGYQEILNSIATLILNIITYEQNGKKNSLLVESIKNKIIENYYNPELNLDKIYQHISYNPDYIRRCFKKEMKMTPVQYLSKVRINNAIKLMEQAVLSNNKISISDIALLCGFNDALYFSKIFKKHTGLSPTEYIKTPKH